MRALTIPLVLAIALPVFGAEPLPLTYRGGETLTVQAVAAQQQWLVIGDKIVCAVVIDGKLQVGVFVLAGVSPEPGPQPQPSPKPQPAPQPQPPPQPLPAQKWQIAIIVESGTLDNLPAEQRTLLSSLSVREDLEKRGHVLLGIIDPDAASTADKSLQPFLSAAAGHQLPAIAIAPCEGGTIEVYPLPRTVNELWKLLERSKASAAQPDGGKVGRIVDQTQGRRCGTTPRRRLVVQPKG